MKVSYFKSSDGTLHENQADYARHETALKVAQVIDAAPLNYTVMEHDDRGNPVIPVGSIGKFVADNAEALRELLIANVVPVRGRKKGSKKADAAPAAADASLTDPTVVSDATVISETPAVAP